MQACNHTNSYSFQVGDKSQPLHLASTKFFTDSLVEWGLSIGLTGATCLVAATPHVAGSLLVFTISTLAINILFRFAATLFERIQLKSASNACRIVAPFNFSLLYGTTGNILVHELGHKGAISSVYLNANPQISVDALFAGSTSWTSCQLSCFGKLLGPTNARLLVSASGALAAVAIATLGIILALEWGNAHFHLRECLLLSSLFSIVGHVNYALSAFSANPNDPKHDFVALWHYGIDPRVAAVILIAIPAKALISYCFIKKYIE